MPRFTSLTNQNALVAATLPKVRKSLADAFFNATPFFAWMRAKNRIIPWDGGESMELRIMYGKNEHARGYHVYEEMDVSPPKGFGNAVFHRAYYRCPISYARATLSANSGVSAVSNLVSDLKMQTEKSLVDSVNTDLFQETEAAADFVDLITPLNYIIENEVEADQESTVGGIAKGTYTWFRNKYYAASGANNLAQIRTCFMDCSKGSDKPDLGLCDIWSYIKIETLLQDKIRYHNRQMADMGFDNISYHGVVIMADNEMNFDGAAMLSGDGGLYFINSDYLKLAIAPDADFKVIQPKYYEMTDSYVGSLLLDIQLVTNNIKRQGFVLGTSYVS